MDHLTASLVTAAALLAAAALPGAERHALGGGPALEESTAPDTTFSLERGHALSLQNLSGRVTVESWGRDEVRIETDEPGNEALRVSARGGGVEVRPGRRHGHGRGRYRITVPEWAGVVIRGSELDVSVEGVNGGVEIRTGEGEVEVRGAKGSVTALSVEGAVTIVNVVGPVSASSGDDDVVLRDVRGPVTARTVDGDITLYDVDASNLEAMTVDGDVSFSGRLAPDGVYRLGTHDGDLTMSLDPDVDADMVVSTFEGEFESDFLVTMERFEAGKSLRFTLGRGGPRVYIEVFDGDIQLRRR